MDKQLQDTLTYIRSVAHLEATMKLAEGRFESLSNKEHWFHYTTPEVLEKRLLRNQFYQQFKVKHIGEYPTNYSEDVNMKITEMMMDYSVWTFGTSCAWMSGECDGYYYNAHLQCRQQWDIRYTVHKLD
jgi:hypothetical protein